LVPENHHLHFGDVDAARFHEPSQRDVVCTAGGARHASWESAGILLECRVEIGDRFDR
jgi:hypothetical protein